MEATPDILPRDFYLLFLYMCQTERNKHRGIKLHERRSLSDFQLPTEKNMLLMLTVHMVQSTIPLCILKNGMYTLVVHLHQLKHSFPYTFNVSSLEHLCSVNFTLHTYLKLNTAHPRSLISTHVQTYSDFTKYIMKLL